MQTRRTAPRRASRLAPTIQPRARRNSGERTAMVALPQPTSITSVRPRWASIRRSLSAFERRALMPIALGCLAIGLVFGITGAFVDSVVASHAGKSAMIFGFAGLRRVAGFGPEAVDASA